MKNFKKFILGLAVAAMVAPAASAASINDNPENASAVESPVVKDFPVTIVNNTGYDIVGLYISSSGDEEWSDNFLEETLAHGEGIRIPCEDAGTYDISLTFDGGAECEVYEVNFQQSVTITLSYNGSEVIFSY
ncbi:MAG: hypothetical protein K6F33_05595 [Bacteroidales bacterium]|nr:hypothetical protein [Bacteroidales bacterium]